MALIGPSKMALTGAGAVAGSTTERRGIRNSL